MGDLDESADGEKLGASRVVLFLCGPGDVERRRSGWMGMQRFIDVVKLVRVHGGCLGVQRRRKTW